MVFVVHRLPPKSSIKGPASGTTMGWYIDGTHIVAPHIPGYNPGLEREAGKVVKTDEQNHMVLFSVRTTHPVGPISRTELLAGALYALFVPPQTGIVQWQSLLIFRLNNFFQVPTGGCKIGCGIFTADGKLLTMVTSAVADNSGWSDAPRIDTFQRFITVP